MVEQQNAHVGEEPENVVIDVDDEYTSTAINFERIKVDLADYDDTPAYTIDDQSRTSRYLLFKVADFVVNAYPTWKKFVFEESDESRARLLRKGIRHDITGTDHPSMKADNGVDGFDMEQGIPKTVDDDIVRNHFQEKFENKMSKYDGEEMLRRYRFSVVVTKLLEVLYRRGYDFEEDFKKMVKTCNSVTVTNDPETETTVDGKVIATACGTVQDAMGEAIKIAFKAESYSFFSETRPRDNFVFDLKELHSHIAFKSRGKITGEMAHVMHDYDVDAVPAFKELMDQHKKKQEVKPLKLKFLHDTPRMFHRGINMLMPTASTAHSEPQHDEQMAEIVQEETTAMEVEEVSEFPDPLAPPPPLDPIIDDPEDDEMEVEEETPSGGKLVEEIMEDEQAEDLAAGQSDVPKRTPVILKPALPEEPHPDPPKLMTARPKPMPKSSAGIKVEGTKATERPTKVKEENTGSSSSKTEQKDGQTSSPSTVPKMTTEVKQVPKRPEAKSRPSESPQAHPEQPVSSANKETAATYVANCRSPTNCS